MYGNHDAYYKNTNQTNSLDFLGLISQNENITIINNNPYFISIFNHTLGLFPWSSEFNYLVDENGNKKIINEQLDYVFGHFEANGFDQNGQPSSGSKLNNNDLYKMGNYLFSGHYHKNKIYYDLLTGKAKLQMVGSPMQLNWGEYSQDKFIYTLNLVNDEIAEFKNTINARYEKIYYSKLINNKYTENELNKLCNKNYIKLVIDLRYDCNKILDLTEYIRKFKPITIEIDYLISLTNDIISESTVDMVKSSTKDNLSYTNDYIKQIYTDINKVNENIKLNKLLEKTQIYYKHSQLSRDEQKELEKI